MIKWGIYVCIYEYGRSIDRPWSVCRWLQWLLTSLASMMPSALRAPSIIRRTTASGPLMSPNLTISARLAARSCCSWFVESEWQCKQEQPSPFHPISTSNKKRRRKDINVGGGVYTPVHLSIQIGMCFRSPHCKSLWHCYRARNRHVSGR